MPENPKDTPLYTTEPLAPEEHAALTADMMAVLEKHNCELGVTSTITLMKRVEAKENKESNGTDSAKEEVSG